VNERLLELGIRGQLMAADLASGLVARARSERGQTTIEWIALMLGLATLVTVLAGKDIWRQAGDTVVDAVRGIFDSSNDKV
jgi:Flp pilus assembly pilin Flp